MIFRPRSNDNRSSRRYRRLVSQEAAQLLARESNQLHVRRVLARASTRTRAARAELSFDVTNVLLDFLRATRRLSPTTSTRRGP